MVEIKKEREALITLVLLLIIFFLYQLRIVLIPFVLAIIITYFLDPVVAKLKEHGMPRMGAVVFISSIFLAFSSFMLTIIIPIVIEEIELLTQRAPTYARELNDFVDGVNKRYDQISLPASVNDMVSMAIRRAEIEFLNFLDQTGETILFLLSRGAVMLISPVLVFYLLKDLERIKKNFWGLIPADYFDTTKELLSKIERVITGFIKGQFIVSCFVGAAAVIGLYLLDLKFPLIIGIMAGILNVVPYFGPFFGTLPAVVVAAFSSPILALWVLILFIVIQQIESSILAPKIMGKEVGLHPLVIIFSLLAGGEIFGFIGLVIAVPLAAIIKEILKHFFDQQRLLRS